MFSKDRLLLLLLLLKWLEADNRLVMSSMLPYDTGIIPYFVLLFFWSLLQCDRCFIFFSFLIFVKNNKKTTSSWY